MQSDIERVLLTKDEIARRVKELAGQITADYSVRGRLGSGEITLITVLTGGMIFCADLIRHLPMRMKIGMLSVSSYPGHSMQAKEGQVLSQQLGEVRGRHVLLVDDILDSGATIRLVREVLQGHQPASVRACVLLRKPTEGAVQTPVDYVGFDIPNEFVVGYGLDWGDYYRNLPDIVTLKRQVIERALGEG